VLTRGEYLSREDFPMFATGEKPVADVGMRQIVETTEKKMITEALVGANWVQTRAASALGISERMLRYKMKKLGISKEGT